MMVIFIRLRSGLVAKAKSKDALKVCIHYIDFSRRNGDLTLMNCISRIDDKDKKIFQQSNQETRRPRWNLYTQTAIENDTLLCGKETYNLTDICNDIRLPRPCTLLNTNEVVYIGFLYYNYM